MSIPPSIATLIEESQALGRTGSIVEAMQRAQQALEQAQALADENAVAAALNCVAFMHFRLGHYEQACALSEQALQRAPAESPACADALLMLGMCATETDDLVRGEDCYRRAIDLSRQLGYDLALVRALHNLAAAVYMPRGQFELALTMEDEAIRLARARKTPEILRGPLIMVAWIHWLQGRRDRLQEALAHLHQVAPPVLGAECYHHVLSGLLALDEGDLPRAQALLARAHSIAEDLGSPELNVQVRLGFSRVQRALGHARAAWDWADDALTIAVRVKAQHFQGMALIERGRAAWAGGELGAAAADFQAAREILARFGAAFDLARATLMLAALYHAQEDARADALWLEALRRIVGGEYAFGVEQERALAFPLIAAHLNRTDPELARLCATLLEHLSKVPPPPLRVLSLGRFRVRQGGRYIAERALQLRRSGELLRLLLVSPGRALAREQVFEALWPDLAPAEVQPLFHQATSTLRRALEPDLPDRFPSRYLQVEEGRVALHLPPGSWLDWEAFEEHVRRAEWQAALALYQGEFLSLDRYAEWAAAPRERLVQLAVRAWVAFGQQHLAQGRLQETLDAAQRALALDPWQEGAVLVGMRACLALHDRAGAIRLYLELERTLRQELNIAPQRALRDLYQSLLQE